ncbi:GRAM domain-containing protein 2B isoform X2 [Narcine bancroftii]|uniref:GRAM domain-containing protein 2B isoform X2 n=1 Tax=Narcine bancroftii TaxID=1343680 RepID=UPI0038310CA2
MLKDGFPSMDRYMKLIGKKVHQLEALSCPNEIGTMAEKQKKSKKKLPALTSNLESVSTTPENQQRDKLPLLMRSQAFDLPDVKNEEVPHPGRKQSSSNWIIKYSASFCKQFKELDTETVIDSFKCALHKEVPYHGKMYVTEHYICFYSNILKETKLVVPVTDVVMLKKQNIALLVPNALYIKTSEGEKHLFASLRSRDFTFKVLKTVCSHLENGSPGNRPENDLKFKTLSELNNSSFEEKNQDLDTIDSIQDSLQSIISGDSADVSRSKTLCNQNKGPKGQPIEETLHSNGNSWFRKVTKKAKSFATFHESTTFNTLVVVYVLLVLVLLISSGYIGFRIVALEEQLMAMGAWPEFHTQSQYKRT